MIIEVIKKQSASFGNIIKAPPFFALALHGQPEKADALFLFFILVYHKVNAGYAERTGHHKLKGDLFADGRSAADAFMKCIS